MELAATVETELARHPIQVVARRTGLSADVIRVWERRYGAVSPRRGGSARRLYSDADIERLRLLRQITQGGRRIGDVATLETLVLQELAREDHDSIGIVGGQGRTSHQYYTAAWEAIRALDTVGLESALAQAASTVSLPILLDEILVPLISAIGDAWASGELRVSHEHFATAQLIALLSELRRTSNMAQTGPKLLLATPAGQNHELGALLAAVVAGTEGWCTTYLSPNAPAAEIAGAARQTNAKALALSITYPADDPHLGDDLRRLRQLLPEEVVVLVGGRAAPAYRPVLEEIGATHLNSLSELRQALDDLRQPENWQAKLRAGERT